MDKNKIIIEQTKDIVGRIINDFDIEVTEAEGVYHVAIKTETEAATVIGRHGETIQALQKLLEVILYKQCGEQVEMLLNVNDYQEKRRERLHYIVAQASSRVRESGNSSYLRGFSAFERKVIHEYVMSEYDDLTSYSVGEGRDRRIVIEVKA